MKIALVHGGTSTEQAVSTLNAEYINKVLLKQGHKTEMVFYDSSLITHLQELAPDLVFLCVQGKGHGDGTLQAILDFLNIPYTGSRTMAAAVINNKIICKKLFQQAGVRTPRWQTLTLADWQAGTYAFSSVGGYPFVAQAPSQGGSFGIELIKSSIDIPKIGDVFSYDDPILIEQFIPGRFATVGLLRRKTELLSFPCIEGIPAESNQQSGDLIVFTNQFTTRLGNFSPEALQEMDDFSREIFNVTCARDYGRVDFIVSEEDGKPYTLEINAVPGLKPSSLFPNGAALYGLSYNDIIEIILQDAIDSV
jgi:D-alanine--D-alanine ligase